MKCVECDNSGGRLVTVIYTTGETEDRTLCQNCSTNYIDGSFVDSVVTQRRNQDPDQGGQPKEFGECTECGAVYPVQATTEDALRPVGLEDGCCPCGNPEFKALTSP